MYTISLFVSRIDISLSQFLIEDLQTMSGYEDAAVYSL